MKPTMYYLLLSLISFLGCTGENETTDRLIDSPVLKNMTVENLSQFSWQNDPVSFDIVDRSLSVTVGEGTDFFNNPEEGSITASAPFLNKEIQGNFVAKALVEPDFSSQWNAVALMVYLDSLHWIKFAFENSDATGPSMVSVVTRGTSDDANGAILKDQSRIWLALVRKGGLYSMHWSEDGEQYYMTRLTQLPNAETIQLGLEMQSPVGKEATHRIHFFEIENKTVENLRDIN